MSLYRNNVGTTRYQGLELSVRAAARARAVRISVAYTRSKLVDDASSVFDASILTGPIANYPVADSFNRALERDYSTGDIPHVFVSSVVWDLPVGRRRARPAARSTGRDRATTGRSTALVTLQSGVPIAVTQTTNFNAFAGFGVQRPNLVGDPTLPADQRTPASGSTPPRLPSRRCSRSGSASRNPVRGPSYRDVDVALMRRVPLRGRHGARAARRDLQPAEHAAARRARRRGRRGQLRHDHDRR